ncbi:MAG: arylsulfatase [Candidatus Solibacter usitatus]|nr:arylsulfatase [Candidatus Solibacter usitatus]
MSTRRTFLGTMAGAAASFAAPKRPNIVVILADDLGFSDIGCYGGEIRTPNLDAMAKRGIRFTQFYNTARCCPTRASLLTGLYPHQAGIGHMMEDRGLPGYRGDLSKEAVTIAQVLRPAGYRTLMCGKWHVTPVNDSKHNWPLQRGFEKFYGTIHGAGSFYDPVTLTRDNTPIPPEGKDYYYTDALTEEAVRMIGDHANKPEPFFLYLAYTSPHWPLHALESDIAKYKGRYKNGWDALREERHKRMIASGIVDRKWPLTPRDPSVPAWKDEPYKEWMQRRMEVYAAQVDRMDQGIGRVLEKLRETGVEEDTLVIFLADNGGCAEELAPNMRQRPLHIPAKTRDGREVHAGNNPKIMPGADDTYQSYGKGWANASNTPFRLYKHWVHEGGISTPLIARWPAVIKKGGSLTNQPGHLIDIMATCADVAGATYPEAVAGNRITPLEGKSLRPVFEGKQRAGHPEIFWEHEGNRAVRQGRWKLVSRFPGKWELFDLQTDRTELHDLSVANAAKKDELAAKWEAWAKRARVEPWDKVPK